MAEKVNLGLTTGFVKEQFRELVEKHGSLAKAITQLLNRDKYLTTKYRFRPLARCEVWQELLRPGVDSLGNLTPVLNMLDTYVRFNRLESRAAAIEELLQADIPDKGTDVGDRFFDDKASSEADAGLGDSWHALQGESSEPSFTNSVNVTPIQIEDVADLTVANFSQSSSVSAVSSVQAVPVNSTLTVACANVFCQTEILTKDAYAQTDIDYSNSYHTENQSSQDQVNTASIQSDSVTSMTLTVSKVKSVSRYPKKHAGDTLLAPFVNKRPRKVPPKKACICSSTSVSPISNVISPCKPVSMVSHCNNVFSGSPMFNSIAPSQPIPPKAALPSLSGNIYVYRGQRGASFSMPPVQNSGQNTFLKLNPRVVITPLPVINPNDIGPQGDMHRQSIQGIGNHNSFSRTPYTFSCIQQSAYLNTLPPHATDGEKDALPKSSANIASTAAVPIFSPVRFSTFRPGIPCKNEHQSADVGFPVPNSSSAFLPNSNHDKLLKKHFENQNKSSTTG